MKQPDKSATPTNLNNISIIIPSWHLFQMLELLFHALNGALYIVSSFMIWINQIYHDILKIYILPNLGQSRSGRNQGLEKLPCHSSIIPSACGLLGAKSIECPKPTFCLQTLHAH